MSLLLTGAGKPAIVSSIPSFSYRNTYIDTGNKAPGSSYTFTAADIGTAHAQRLAVLGVMSGFTNILPSAITVGGNSATLVAQNSSNAGWSIWQVAIATGTTGDIVITAQTSTFARIACAVWAGYPLSATMLDSASDTQAGTTDAVAADVNIVTGGFVVYVGGHFSVLGDFVTTWNGTDAVVEDTDQQIEASNSFTAGHIICTETNSTRDLNFAESTSGSKNILAASWGAS